MPTRRSFLKILVQTGASLASAPFSLAGERAGKDRVLVNDIHSQLNPTYVREVVNVESLARLQEAVTTAKRTGQAVSIAGGRHAMGGQQFGTGTLLLDTRPMSRVLNFDDTRGLVEVEAGIQWPELISYLIEAQQGQPRQWGIIQKQTGADRLCLGGALSANVHGRGLTFKPIIGDVESFRLVDANGAVRQCSRSENSELFRLAIGGYGVFGVIVSITLRLVPRRKLQRVVEIIETDDLIPALERRIADGYVYGDCQFSIDPGSDGFLKKGVFSCYRPVDNSVPMPATQKKLSAADWRKLYSLAHNDPKRIFAAYSSYYLSTSGQIYWSDTSNSRSAEKGVNFQALRPFSRGTVRKAGEQISSQSRQIEPFRRNPRCQPPAPAYAKTSPRPGYWTRSVRALRRSWIRGASGAKSPCRMR